MRSVKALVWAGSVMVAAACAILGPSDLEWRRLPQDIRTGAAEMAITPVEPEVSREEVSEAVRALVEGAPFCISWPALWMEGGRQTAFVVRFDLMARDWGSDVALESERRMQEFLDWGFLTKRARPEIDARAFEFSLTSEGRSYLRGRPSGNVQASFCPSAGLRLVEITELEWGEFACGNLRAHFSYSADTWPDWARTPEARARLAAAHPPAGAAPRGVVSLSRQWFRPSLLPSGRRNGGLSSVCYDRERGRVVGDDLDLHAP